MSLTSELLRDPATREAFALRVREDIDNYCLTKYERNSGQTRMPASELADDCAAYLWFNFRWADREQKSPRMSRFLDRGNWAEGRFVEWLRGAGYNVADVDPDASENRLNKQFRLRTVSGHVGGFLDGIIPQTPHTTELRLLFECKAISTGPFQAIVKHGIAKERPKHFGQMSQYGKHYKIDFGLYCMINRNDDDIYIECVELDMRLAEDLERKARDIISSPTRPPRVAENSAFWKCKNCAFSDVCHGQKPYARNCRTCRHSEPIEGGKWRCNYYDGKPEIPFDVMPKGCEVGYVQIPK
jgi:hypothetical protein